MDSFMQRRLDKYGFYIPHVGFERRHEVVGWWANRVKVGDIIYGSSHIDSGDAKNVMRKYKIEIEFVGIEEDDTSNYTDTQRGTIKVYHVVNTENESMKTEKYNKDIIFDINDIVT
jgi:hypothetical protein